MSDKAGRTATSTLEFLSGGGEMGELLRHHDWRKSPLGSPHQWPQSLRTAVRLMLNLEQPMMIFWGQEAVCLYNNTFRQALGPERHPHALGRPAREAWKEAWPVVGTDVEQVMKGKGPIKQLNYKLPYTRYGQQKYGHWTFSHTPIEEEAASWGIGGVLSVCTEATDQECAPPVFNPEFDILSQMFNHASAFMVYLSGPEHRYEIANPSHAQLIGHRPVMGKTIREALPDAVEQGFEDILDHVYATGTTYRANNAQYSVQVTPGGPVNERILDFVYQPLWGPDGKISGVFAEGTDVTDQVLTQEELERVNRELAETLHHQKESERRNSFRLKLTDSLRSLADPDEITAAATALLGEFLGVTRYSTGTFQSPAKS